MPIKPELDLPLKNFKDMETLKKEEWNRRRLLRLEQVRQQSKDIANLVRQKVQSEREKQLGLCEQRASAKTQQWQVKKLKALQVEYQTTLDSVGKGHEDASLLPDADTIRKEEAEKLILAAQKRGQEALIRLKEEEAARRRADEERRSQLLHTRAIEEARSAAVVALPTPESTVGIKSFPSKKSVYVPAPPPKAEGNVKRNEIPQWPKKSWPQASLPLGISQQEHRQGDTAQNEDRMSCGGDFTFKQQRSINVSSCGDSVQGIDSSQSSILQKSCKQTTSRNTQMVASTSDVKLYDYTSCYQSQYDKTSGFVEKIQPETTENAKLAAERELSTEVLNNKPDLETVHREQQRSRNALQKLQAQRDYKQLMGSLSILARQNASSNLYPNAPSSHLKDKNHDEKLRSAVENLLEDGEKSISDSTVVSSATDTPDESIILSRLEETPGSAPKLNVGRWQPPHLSQEDDSPPSVHSPSTDSIVLAPPPQISRMPLGLRQEHATRETALRSLVQRINEERHSLLANQPPDRSQTDGEMIHDGENDHGRVIKNLEEKVLQQRKELKAQRSEVKRLDASIAVPDQVKRNIGESTEESVYSSSVTHESIIIEPSHSEEYQDRSSSSRIGMQDNSFETSKRSNVFKMSKQDRKTFVSSPTKDGTKYCMDVSLSSVIMDQTENNSSSSTSVSLHGVQVLVKVCGTDEANTSESRSISVSGIENMSPKNTEPAGDEAIVPSRERIKKKSIECDHVLKKGDLKEARKKGKGGDKYTSDSAVRKAPKTKLVSDSHGKEKSSHHKERKKTKENIPNTEALEKKAPKDFTSKPREKIDSKKKKNNHENLEKKPMANKEHPASSSTSYLSPPDHVFSSLTQDIKTLIALAQNNYVERAQTYQTPENIHQKATLAAYINRLLAMSRESIEKLNVSCSEVSTPPSAIFDSFASDMDGNVTDMVSVPPVPIQYDQTRQVSVDHPDNSTNVHQKRMTDNHQQSDSLKAEGDSSFPPFSIDQDTLTEMTRQCHEKICAFNKMIEDVRRQAAMSSPISNQSDSTSYSYNHSRSPQLLDSTAYMSPPPQVLEWADIAYVPQSWGDTDDRMSLDPYGAAVMQLLAEVRGHSNQKLPEPLAPSLESPIDRSPQDENRKSTGRSDFGQSRPKPPVAFWKNIERCNVTSPTEPHELSTIPELGTTLLESVGSQPSAPGSPHRTLTSPTTPNTPPDVIAELLRRRLLTSPFAWAKKKGVGSDGKKKTSFSSDASMSMRSSHESDLSSGKTGSEQSDISASKESNTVSLLSQNSNSSASRYHKTNLLMSPVDVSSSADDVEVDFRRMGIGWVGAMLRKTKEAGALSSTSSSDNSPLKIDNNDLKDLGGTLDNEPILSSSLVIHSRQGRSHSTPVKVFSGKSSSSESH